MSIKVLILSAGRGKRLGKLTNDVPKPLMPIAGKPIIAHLLESLAARGLCDIIINLGHLREQMMSRLGNGSEFGVKITYSPEPEGALETGGGIHHALPLLSNSNPFIVVNGDIWTDYPFEKLVHDIPGFAHLVMVDNPPFHPQGDFAVTTTGLLDLQQENRLTYSGIGIYRHELFEHCRPGRFPLAPLLVEAIQNKKITGEHFTGAWHDSGTPDRLERLDRVVRAHQQANLST